MEHIEPEYLHAVLQAMQDLRPKCVFLAISTIPANKTLPDGRNAHILLESADWWRTQLEKHFTTIQGKAEPEHYLYRGSPLP